MATLLTSHAVRRYQERIENVPTATVCQRLRAIEAWGVRRGTVVEWFGGSGAGPAAKLLMTDDGTAVKTVYPLTDRQVALAGARGAWTDHG
jgi:hypothetical protein